MELLLKTLNLLADFSRPWAICGGYALEAFAGQHIRPHGDVDVCLLEQVRADIIAYLLDRGWRILEFRGMGKVKPINSPADSEPGRNLMALLPGCPLVEFFPCEEEGLLYHRFHHTGMTALNYLDILFSREMDGQLLCPGNHTRRMDKAILMRDGLPILAPEIALLHKSSRPEEASAQADFAAVYPLLDDEQRAWLQSALAALYPAGHPWLT